MKIVSLLFTVGLVRSAPRVELSYPASHEKERRLLPVQSQPCIVTEVFTTFEDHSEKHEWVCELAAEDVVNFGQTFVNIEGLNEQDIATIQSGVTTLFVEGATISNEVLVLPQGAAKEFGQAQPRMPAAVMHSLQASHVNDVDGTSDRKLAPLLGTHKVLVVRVVANGIKTTTAPSAYFDEVFGTGAGAVTLRERIDSCSYGELRMDPFAGITTTGYDISTGVIEVYVDINPSESTAYQVRALVIQALQAELGDLATQFDHVMFCLPPGTSKDGKVTWAAFGAVNGWMTVFNDKKCDIAQIQAHEIGHNLGLKHASENVTGKSNDDNEYGDDTGIMGNGISNRDAKLCFNPAKSWQLGWYSLRHIELDFTATRSFEGQLIGVNDYQHTNSEGKYVSVKVPTPGSDVAYYVGFNLAAGINVDTPEAANMVTVQSQVGKWFSYLVAKLESGGLFSLPNFSEGKTLHIDVKSINLASSPPTADVQIYLEQSVACTVSSDCILGDPCVIRSCQPGGICLYDTSPCPGNLEVKLTTDTFPEETTWKIYDVCANREKVSKGDYRTPNAQYTEFAVLGQSQYTFMIMDSSGNGFEGLSGISATFDGIPLVNSWGNFGSTTSFTFGKTSCDTVVAPPLPTPQPLPRAAAVPKQTKKGTKKQAKRQRLRG